jgi:hypothetical protein
MWRHAAMNSRGSPMNCRSPGDWSISQLNRISTRPFSALTRSAIDRITLSYWPAAIFEARLGSVPLSVPRQEISGILPPRRASASKPRDPVRNGWYLLAILILRPTIRSKASSAEYWSPDSLAKAPK